MVPNTQEKFFFVFHGRQRPLVTLSGLPQQDAIIFEARAYPSLEYAMGETWEEAKNNLRDLIDQEINNARVSAEEWYSAKIAELEEADRTALYASAFKALIGREGTVPIVVGSINGLVVDEIEGGADGSSKQEAHCHG